MLSQCAGIVLDLAVTFFKPCGGTRPVQRGTALEASKRASSAYNALASGAGSSILLAGTRLQRRAANDMLVRYVRWGKCFERLEPFDELLNQC